MEEIKPITYPSYHRNRILFKTKEVDHGKNKYEQR